MIKKTSKWNCKKRNFYGIDCFMGKIIICSMSESKSVQQMTFKILESTCINVDSRMYKTLHLLSSRCAFKEHRQ